MQRAVTMTGWSSGPEPLPAHERDGPTNAEQTPPTARSRCPPERGGPVTSNKRSDVREPLHAAGERTSGMDLSLP